MFGWQNILFGLLLASSFLVAVSVYGYFLQRGLSVGGLLLSWNANNNYRANVLLMPLFILLTAIIIISLDKAWLLNGLWVACLWVVIPRGALIVATGRLASIRVAEWLVSSLLAVFLSYVINILAIYAGSDLQVSPTNVAAILWSFGVLATLFLVSQLMPSHFSDISTNRKIIAALYQKYYRRYHKLLKANFTNEAKLQRLLFAIMITEDLNRPAIFRFFERLAFPLGFIGTTGIMQVTHAQKLSDKQSIILAQNLIEGFYQAAKDKHSSEYMQLCEVAYLYNDGDFYTELIAHAYFTLTELDAFKGSIKPIE